MNKQIEIEVKKMWTGAQSGEIDNPLEAFERIIQIATKSDIPQLLELIDSDYNNFWTRELLSEPISRLGDSSCLPILIKAIAKNEQEGHDNDSLNFYVAELIERELDSSIRILKQHIENSESLHKEIAEDLLEYCNELERKKRI